MELLFVVMCVCGDMPGEGCREPDAIDEALAAESGIEEEGALE
jgi:hypothetical protein